jgi:hypothetical protein
MDIKYKCGCVLTIGVFKVEQIRDRDSGYCRTFGWFSKVSHSVGGE